jgi:hypothetical protein
LWELAMAARPLLLVWLFTIFVVLARRAWRTRPSDLERNAMIPLRDGDA